MRTGALALLVAPLLLDGCGGSSASGSSAAAPAAVVVRQVSVASTLGTACGTAIASASSSPPEAYAANSAVQPQLAASPVQPTQLFGVWEQDRWNAIGTRAIEVAASGDGGLTWGTTAPLPFSACGSTVTPGAAYDRASDPSIAVGHGNVVVASALAFSAGGFLASGGTSAVLVARSTDGGATWQAAQAVHADAGSGSGPFYFNDRDAIAADPAGPDVYLVWDRLASDNTVESIPTWLAHSGDGGLTWDAARVIFDPGVLNQTFNNQPLVLPDGSVVVVFTLLNGFGAQLQAIRSADHGATWSNAVYIATPQSSGTTDPISGGPPIRDSANMAQTAVDPVNGTLAAVWQQTGFAGAAHDGIALSLSRDKGATWSAPVQVNAVPAVAAFDPAVHFGAGGRIAVTYYDFRDDVAGAPVLGTGAWLRESADGGTTWTETRIAGPFDLLQAPPADLTAGTTGSARFLGDQQALAWNGSSWTALFGATTAQGGRVFAGVVP